MRSTFADYDQERMDEIDHHVDEEVHHLETDLQLLDEKCLALYCLSCCERLLPNYGVFHTATGVGHYESFRNLLNRYWRGAAEGEFQLVENQTELDRIDFVLDGQPSHLAVYAANAISLVEALVKFFPKCSASMAAQCYRAVIEDLIHYLLDSCLEKKLAFSDAATFVFSSDEWNREVALHEKIKETLKAAEKHCEEVVSELRVLATNNGRSNIGLTFRRTSVG